MNRAATLALLLVCGSALAAPPQIPLRGTVSDVAGTPLDGVFQVTLELDARQTQKLRKILPQLPP